MTPPEKLKVPPLMVVVSVVPGPKALLALTINVPPLMVVPPV